MSDDLSDERIIRALGHPLRRRLLAILDHETASSKELAQRLGETIGVVSYHVGVLRDLDLLEVAGATRRRGATETHYRSGSRPTLDEDTWASLSPTIRGSRWNGELRELASDLDAASRHKTLELDPARIAKWHVELDEAGSAAASAALASFWETLEQIAIDCEQRSSRRRLVAVATLLFPVERPDSRGDGDGRARPENGSSRAICSAGLPAAARTATTTR